MDRFCSELPPFQMLVTNRQACTNSPAYRGIHKLQAHNVLRYRPLAGTHKTFNKLPTVVTQVQVHYHIVLYTRLLTDFLL